MKDKYNNFVCCSNLSLILPLLFWVRKMNETKAEEDSDMKTMTWRNEILEVVANLSVVVALVSALAIF